MTTQSRPSGGATQTVISGTHRFKYFKRPIMPRVNAYPPQVLLAPTVAAGVENNPLVPVPVEEDVATKEMGIQTMYRESEAQTLPYTPDHVVQEGKDDPEVLLLKNLTYNNGLPLGKKQIEMIEFARAKRDMEMNLPPFTDEASLNLRKKLMEQQEMREFRIRENEMDKAREDKLEKLSDMLSERESSNEFMNSQRLESVRLLKMEEREQVLLKLRNKRIKILRRLAHQRNMYDPVLSDTPERDIITDYFDRGSVVYAPIKRDGKYLAPKVENFDISSRTAPLNNINNIVNLEYSIPRSFMNDTNEGNAVFSKSAPVGATSGLKLPENRSVNRVRAAEPRLTSAAQRNLRQTKRDIEEMHQILTQKKYEQLHGSKPSSGMGRSSSPTRSAGTEKAETPGTGGPKFGTLLSKKPKGRPPTPDLTRDRTQIYVPPEDEDLSPVLVQTPKPPVEEVSPFKFDHEFQLSVILLQRLIRGRAVQNIMFEGKYRRRELIAELKAADEAEAHYQEPTASELEQKEKSEREERFRFTSIDNVAGSASIGLLHLLAQEKVLTPVYLIDISLVILMFFVLFLFLESRGNVPCIASTSIRCDQRAKGFRSIRSWTTTERRIRVS
jgi:hypothetical protein